MPTQVPVQPKTATHPGVTPRADSLNIYSIAQSLYAWVTGTPNPPATLPLPTGAATDTNQTNLQAIIGTKADTAGASAAVANQSLLSRLSGVWTVLGSLTDAAATAWDNTSNSISSLLRGIGGNIAAVLNGNAVRVGGQFIRVPCTQFTRPTTIGTVVAGSVCGPVTTPAVMTFPNCARSNGGSGLLKAALLNFKWPSGTPVNTGFAQRLKIFNVAPTPIGDGSLWTVLQANFGSWQGSFDFNSMNAEGATYTGSDSIHGMGAPVAGAADADIAFTCAAGDRNLYGVLINEGTNTQVASMVVDAALIVDQN